MCSWGFTGPDDVPDLHGRSRAKWLAAAAKKLAEGCAVQNCPWRAGQPLHAEGNSSAYQLHHTAEKCSGETNKKILEYSFTPEEFDANRPIC